MKDNVEKSLKRWLKNKVKVTMALVTVFLITGSIGYGEDYIIDENSENQGIEGIKLNTQDEEIKDKKNIKISVESIIKDGSGSATGIQMFGNSNLTLQADNEIIVEAKGTSENNKESSATGIQIASYNTSSTVNINGGNKVEIKASSDSHDAYAMYFHSGEVIVESKNIYLESIGSSKNDNYSAIIDSVDTNINLTTTEGNIILNGESKTGKMIGIKSNVMFDNQEKKEINLNSSNDIIMTIKGKEKVYGLENDSENSSIILSGKNIELSVESFDETKSDYNATVYSQSGKVGLESSNLIKLASNSENNMSYGVFSSGGNSKIEVEGKEGIKIKSESKNNYTYGVHGEYGSINDLNSSNGKIKIKTFSENNMSFAVDSYNSTNILKSSDDIVLKAKSINSTSSGIYSRGVAGISDTKITSDKNVIIKSEGNKGMNYGIYSYIGSEEGKEANSKLSIDAGENILISSSMEDGVISYGAQLVGDISLKTADNGIGVIQITSFANTGHSTGIYSGYNKANGSNNIKLDASNIIINSKANKKGLSRAILAQEEGLSLISDNGIYLSSISNENQSFGIHAQAGSSTTMEGDNLYIYAKGNDISVPDNFEYEGNNFTVSKLFNATQGIRLEGGAILDLAGVKNMSITSSDIAVTANNSNFIFNGTSYFEGNDYLVQNYTNDHLLVRPVIQAVDNGKINLSGDTTVISNTGHDGETDNVRINNVGIYSQGHTDKGVTGESVVNIEGKLTVISGNDILKEKYPDITELPELQNLTADEIKELISNTDISLMATAGGVININSNDNVFLIGDILAGKENSLISVKGGNGNPNSMIVVGEVLAANGGFVGLDMSNGGYFVGRADDYFRIEEFKDTDFRNNKFSGDIEKGGEIGLRLGNGAVWNAIGQSYVTHLDFTEGGGTVDLTYEGNALRIKNLSGEGTFNITLDSEDKKAGNMLYIYNVGSGVPEPLSLLNNDLGNSENEILTQTVNLTDSVLKLQPGEKLRFATLGEDATGKVQFVANEVKEKGINNVSYNTENSAYDENDEENILYNGSEANNNKPGNDLINNSEETGFNATENWYLTRGEENINDGGKTILEMSRANYAGAVYLDNLNKRLGDMSFVDGKEGIWVRLRNDRVGEDSEYRLHNYMTQLGYDKPYPMEEGKGTEYRGIALEITKGDMDYKNINGDANIDRQALWLYDTNVYNNGFYSDYVFRAGRMESEFDIYGRETGVKVEGNYKNLFLGASAEYGYRMNLSEKSYFEPQVQLQYTYIDGTDYTTNQDTKVKLDEIHSLIGRAGFRLGHDFYNEEGRKTTTIYAKADVNHEFLGEQRVDARDLTGSLAEEYRKYENDGTWYDIGMGASKDITPDFNVYMDVERQIGRTRDDQSWQFNLGFRYRFNEIKDLNPVVMLSSFSLKGDNYFEFDKSELNSEGKAVVKKISTELNKNDVVGVLNIEGHTDSKGTKEYNQNLSEKRAKYTENEFKKNITNSKIQYEVKGYGEERPIADNNTEEGRAKNRRVEIKFEGTQEK
ncbi:autotransporter outer membrane beta-barrel domain-containing protein [Fusobacterium mortiferum]|uniref:Autotransporter outer membrane beta-barrel domain-containing protein n=1 Tax=Fusobacterium mortiferum TaxID=850 RepID=A0A414PW71_FUSMR|nr:autotransporter outer membrane beta-barrel domain-containing protein [Fusobacterium mortiferum]RHF72750.1 autotransporter outer membrane beta-barrel domain-containing protein [Fusobacterium mortiferum]